MTLRVRVHVDDHDDHTIQRVDSCESVIQFDYRLGRYCFMMFRVQSRKPFVVVGVL